MEPTRIYPDREKQYEQELRRLKADNLSHRNEELILQFRDFLLSTSGCGEYTASKRIRDVRQLCHLFDKDLDKATKEDALRVGVLINQSKHSFTTKQTDIGRLKRFYRWFKDEDPRLRQIGEIREEAEKFYKAVEKLKASGKAKQINPVDVLSEEDIKTVLDKGCRSIRDTAFIAMLHESGCRIGEFLGITLADINILDNYVEISVTGKTGRRTIYLVKSLPYLFGYLKTYPVGYDKKNPDNANLFLWTSKIEHSQYFMKKHPNRNKIDFEPINYIGAVKIVKRCFERAGINKKCNLHWFRHSRCSILAPEISEPILCKAMGWSLGTKQYRNYTHLCTQQVENVMLKLNGIDTEDNQVEKPIRCICGTLNNLKERYCWKCYKPLNVQVALEDNSTEVKELKLINREAMKTMQFFMEMMKDVEMMKKFEEFKKVVEVSKNTQ